MGNKHSQKSYISKRTWGQDLGHQTGIPQSFAPKEP